MGVVGIRSVGSAGRCIRAGSGLVKRRLEPRERAGPGILAPFP